MSFIADLHIHSSHSIATSRDISPETLYKWAQLKGVTVLGTGDFTHPSWISELKEKLEPLGNGLFILRKRFRGIDSEVPDRCKGEVYFILSSEISCIYKKGGKVRKVHNLVYMPGFEEAEKLNMELRKIGNIKSDGRPILGLDSKELLKIALDVSQDSILIPAHAWTPHFSVFGSGSGFNSLEECFEELTPHIHAIETGLSSDPPMNWRVSSLDHITLISNSDAHSPQKIGREANIFDTELSYKGIMGGIKSRKGFLGTVEFFPEEGKYHYDGHRACKMRLSPEDAKKNKGFCPACGKKVTVGVMHRVEELSDRPEGFRFTGAPPYHSLISLKGLISYSMGVGEASRKVEAEYMKILKTIGPELEVLMDIPVKELESVNPSISLAVSNIREGRVRIEPGYDGEYGKVMI
ncbi:MAG: endonuclease Q family protein [Deltaproteobacteria bacterium]|nr:endonuclease Q family protein [Deltaproteobacteria bacterium]